MTKITVMINKETKEVIGISSNGINLPFDIYECNALESYKLKDFYNHPYDEWLK